MESNQRPTCCYRHGNELGVDDGSFCLGKFDPGKPTPPPQTSEPHLYYCTECGTVQYQDKYPTLCLVCRSTPRWGGQFEKVPQ